MKTPQQFASYMFEKGLGDETETGELVLVHKAVEKMAVYYGIQLKLEVCQNSFEKKSAIVKCTATKDNHVYESLGEVHPETNSFSYYVSVAEKRAADRAILKCLGIHGDFFSQEENPEFIKNRKKDFVINKVKQKKEYKIVDLKIEQIKKNILSQKDETSFNKLIQKYNIELKQLAESKAEEDFFVKLSLLQNKLTKGEKPNGKK